MPARAGLPLDVAFLSFQNRRTRARFLPSMEWAISRGFVIFALKYCVGIPIIALKGNENHFGKGSREATET